MTYRLKLFLVLGSLVVLSNGVIAAANYRLSNRLIRAEIHRKARAIATTVAVLIDPAEVAVIDSRGAESLPEYARLLATLRAVRDANRREDVWVDRIFTLFGAAQDPKVVEYGVDSEQSFEFARHPGDIYQRDDRPVEIGLAGIDRLAQNLSDFQAGYNNAFAPVHDQSGRLIAEIGVTLKPAPASTLTQIGAAMFAPFAVTVLLAIALALYLSHSVSRPLYSLRASIEHGHANCLTLEMASVAYWYQTMPSKPFPPLPNPEERIPLPEIDVRDAHRWRDAWRKAQGGGFRWGNEKGE